MANIPLLYARYTSGGTKLAIRSAKSKAVKRSILRHEKKQWKKKGYWKKGY